MSAPETPDVEATVAPLSVDAALEAASGLDANAAGPLPVLAVEVLRLRAELDARDQADEERRIRTDERRQLAQLLEDNAAALDPEGEGVPLARLAALLRLG